jgi:hypothetical protein
VKRLQTIRSVLAIVVLILLGLSAWQGMQISGLTADLAQSQRSLEHGAERAATDRFKSLRREEMVGMVQWLDDFTRSSDGLQRPNGLWRADLKGPDTEAIGVWVLDVYLQARLTGKSDAEARQAVADHIRRQRLPSA